MNIYLFLQQQLLFFYFFGFTFGFWYPSCRLNILKSEKFNDQLIMLHNYVISSNPFSQQERIIPKEAEIKVETKESKKARF